MELPTEGSGQRRQLTKSGFVSAKEAAAARAEVLRQHEADTLPRDGKLTVATWLRRWLITQEEVRGLRVGTIIDYRRHIEQYWIPRIGHLKLSKLRSQHVTDALAAIRRQRAEAINAAQAVNAQSLAKAAAADELRKAQGLKRGIKPERIPVPRPFGATTACLCPSGSP